MMSLMRKQIFLQENILKKIFKNLFIIFSIFLAFNSNTNAKEKWIIDKNISNIAFEVPVLFAKNVNGKFKNLDGFVEIDLINNQNNKAIISVEIDNVDINYTKYKNLILSPIFFDSINYPIAVLDTKKFSYQNEKELFLDVELTIKGISKKVQTKLIIKKLTNELIQILGTLEFSRTYFNIGIGNWSNTAILKDKIKIESDIFLIKE